MRLSLLLLSMLLATTALASTPAEAVAAAHADIKRLQASGVAPADLYAYRYFRVTTTEPKERAYFLAAFQLHLNFLSRYRLPVHPVEVAPQLLRVDIDELKWDRGTLEAARFADPFFHEQKEADHETVIRGIYWPGGVDSRLGKFFKRNTYRETVKAGEIIAQGSGFLPRKEYDYLREALFTEVPVLDAEWFLAQSARQLSLANQQTGLGYYDFLQLKNRQDYFDLIKFREKDSLEKEVRAIQEVSGVSLAPRILVGWSTAQGPAWVALDTNDPRRAGIALANPDRGAFKHQIEEWYGTLPNDLPATFLSDNNGTRQNNAPADAAGFHDDSRLNEGRDGRIHVHLACLRCHAGQVLLPIDDYYRRTFRTPRGLGVKEKKRFLDLQALYFSDLDGKLKKDRADYQDAYRRATITPLVPVGLPAQRASEAYARAFADYERPVTLGRAARDLGVTREAWLAALTWQRQTLTLDVRLAPLEADPDLPIARVTWEDAFGAAQQTMLGYNVFKGVRR